LPALQEFFGFDPNAIGIDVAPGLGVESAKHPLQNGLQRRAPAEVILDIEQMNGAAHQVRAGDLLTAQQIDQLTRLERREPGGQGQIGGRHQLGVEARERADRLPR
jgi:hypothetical protein